MVKLLFEFLAAILFYHLLVDEDRPEFLEGEFDEESLDDQLCSGDGNNVHHVSRSEDFGQMWQMYPSSLYPRERL